MPELNLSSKSKTGGKKQWRFPCPACSPAPNPNPADLPTPHTAGGTWTRAFSLMAWRFSMGVCHVEPWSSDVLVLARMSNTVAESQMA